MIVLADWIEPAIGGETDGSHRACFGGLLRSGVCSVVQGCAVSMPTGLGPVKERQRGHVPQSTVRFVRIRQKQAR